MILRLAILSHLIGFAAFAGAAVIQHRLLMASASAADAARDAFERAAATAVTRAQLPGIFLSLLSGIVMLMLRPSLLNNHWMHLKLGIVIILLVVSHLEMFNARKLVRARAAGNAAEAEARKTRHGVYGMVDVLGVLVVLIAVIFIIPV